MADRKQFKILKQGVEVWNTWRKKNPKVRVNLRGANLKETDLRGVDFRNAILEGINFSGADLENADLANSVLGKVNFCETNLRGVSFQGANLNGVNLQQAVLGRNNFSGANLNHTDLESSNLSQANLRSARLMNTNLRLASLANADLEKAMMVGANLRDADLTNAHLVNANLGEADLVNANLTGANLSGANLKHANLTTAILTNADLSNCNLHHTNLILAKVDNACISNSKIFGANVWDLKGEFKEQKQLIITPGKESEITVDNIEIAQFIYLILNNEKIRGVLNTLTSKTVLILGRFAIPERKVILDALRNKLREYDLAPIVFDFERPTDKDFTETIKTLAGICYFVIADVTNPKSSPLELQATVPDYQIPFVPIIQEGESPFAMMVDLQKKFPWVLPTRSYASIETLMKALKPGIIDPAVEMRNKLRLVKAQEQVTESLKDYLDKSL
jgi:uncharacterized protein YjbI with pentapeptide repeats